MKNNIHFLLYKIETIQKQIKTLEMLHPYHTNSYQINTLPKISINDEEIGDGETLLNIIFSLQYQIICDTASLFQRPSKRYPDLISCHLYLADLKEYQTIKNSKLIVNIIRDRNTTKAHSEERGLERYLQSTKDILNPEIKNILIKLTTYLKDKNY